MGKRPLRATLQAWSLTAGFAERLPRPQRRATGFSPTTYYGFISVFSMLQMRTLRFRKICVSPVVTQRERQSWD